MRHEGGGGSEFKGSMNASAYFLAYYDIETQSYFNEEGRLSWPLTKEEEETRSYFHRFKDNTLYKVKVRFLKDRAVSKGRLESMKNEFYLIEELEENAKCLQLEQRLEEYKSPFILKDNTLGVLTLDKTISTFEGHVIWSNRKICISLEVNQQVKSTWTKARKAMVQMLEVQNKWDKEIRDFAANELTELANDWQNEGDEEITRKDFARRISIINIVMSSGGSFAVYFDDDDIFFGHFVTVYGNLKTGIKAANIEG